MTKLNRLAKTIASLKSRLPQSFHSAAITLAFNTQVCRDGLSLLELAAHGLQARMF